MPGRPKLRALIEALEARTREEFGDENPNATHLDYVEHWTANGQTLLTLANQISTPELVISGEQISRYLRKSFGDADVSMRLSRARTRGAFALVEQTLQLVDGAPLTSEDAQKARNQMVARQWVAERWNRDELGTQKQGVSVTLNIGTAHIGAMRVREIEQSAIVPVIAAPAEDASFEIIES